MAALDDEQASHFRSIANLAIKAMRLQLGAEEAVGDIRDHLAALEALFALIRAAADAPPVSGEIP